MLPSRSTSESDTSPRYCEHNIVEARFLLLVPAKPGVGSACLISRTSFILPADQRGVLCVRFNEILVAKC
jgi:hypothetical protein